LSKTVEARSCLNSVTENVFPIEAEPNIAFKLPLAHFTKLWVGVEQTIEGEKGRDKDIKTDRRKLHRLIDLK